MKSLFTAFALIAFAACNKENDIKCESKTPACKDVVPTDQVCQAYFTRWFYDPETNRCRQAGYSGCIPRGFATKIECDSCKCN